MPKRWPPFSVTVDGEKIELYVRGRNKHQFDYSPEFEEREACVLSGLGYYSSYLSMPKEERAKVVAHYRLHKMVEIVANIVSEG